MFMWVCVWKWGSFQEKGTACAKPFKWLEHSASNKPKEGRCKWRLMQTIVVIPKTHLRVN